MISEKKIQEAACRMQKREITQYAIYRKLSAIAKKKKNRDILQSIAGREKSQYEFWKRLTGRDASPRRIKVSLYFLMARILGPSFTLRLMENEKSFTMQAYRKLKAFDGDSEEFIRKGEAEELDILKLIDEEKMKYTDSMILGLNDGLVELVGGLAGFTFALQEAKLIAAAGLIMGVAGAFSLAGSEYLSTIDKGDKNPVKASVYTGVVYFIIVALLILPFLIHVNPFFNLAVSLLVAVFVIALFNFYVSVAKGVSFRKRFIPMISIGMGVAVFNFVLGLGIRELLGISP